MGACILCGKSAGPFYSLHKNCYKKYEDSKQTIASYLSSELETSTPSCLAGKVLKHIADCNFIIEAQKRTLNRALEYFAEQYLDIRQISLSQIKAWTALLDELSPDESLFVDPHFLIQQYNLYALYELNNSSLPESNSHPANYAIQMYDQEQLWWCFNHCKIEQDLPVENQQQWSVLMQIMNSMFAKKHKRSIEKKALGDGRLFVTNKRIYFDGSEFNHELMHINIYSVTPIKQGVRLQAKANTAKPQTFICEDARLLYAFIKNAQKQNQ